MSHTTEVKSVPIRDINAVRAAVAELKRQGINVELKQDAVPRMYYKDQMQRHMGRKSEVCDYVIELKDAKYDIALIKNDDGTFSPVFDDWQKSIANQVGQKFDGKAEHWSGKKDDTEQSLHSIGKFLQSYSKHAAINAATAQGYRVNGSHTDAQGNIQLELEC